MNRIGVDSLTPFLCAARHCAEARIFKLLVERGADRTAIDSAGNSALHLAAAAGNLTAIKFTIQAGRNPNVKRKSDEQTPIMAAAKSQFLKLFIYITTHPGFISMNFTY